MGVDCSASLINVSGVLNLSDSHLEIINLEACFRSTLQLLEQVEQLKLSQKMTGISCGC